MLTSSEQAVSWCYPGPLFFFFLKKRDWISANDFQLTGVLKTWRQVGMSAVLLSATSL